MVGIAEFNIQLYTPGIEFVYSLRDISIEEISLLVIVTLKSLQESMRVAYILLLLSVAIFTRILYTRKRLRKT